MYTDVRAASTKSHPSELDAGSPVSLYETVSRHRNSSGGEIISLVRLLNDLSHLNPGEQPGPDYLSWTGEERLTWVFQSLKAVADKDSGEKTESLWNASQAFLLDLMALNPPGSTLHDSAATILESIGGLFSVEIRTADRDYYASNALKSIGLDIDVHHVDGDPSFFSVENLVNALQDRLKEAGYPFEIYQEDGEWIAIEDVSAINSCGA